MCGICGTINTGTEKQLQKMVDLLKHRGPDDKGISYLKSRNNFVYFGNTRLSIIDLSQMGHMPIYSIEKRMNKLLFNIE